MRHFKIILAIAYVLLMVLPVASCGGTQVMPTTAEQRTAASLVGQAANDALPMLVEHYKQQALAIVDGALTEAEAAAQLASLDLKYDPIWRAHHSLELAQHRWADALESNGDTAAALTLLKGAWCSLQAIWPPEVSPIPLQMIECPGGQP